MKQLAVVLLTLHHNGWDENRDLSELVFKRLARNCVVYIHFNT